MDMAGGTGIDTVVGATDTVTVAIDSTVVQKTVKIHLLKHKYQALILRLYRQLLECWIMILIKHLLLL